MNKEIWPNFFIVGAMRAGTTSLYEYLKKSKFVYLPSIKEPNYFTSAVDPKQLLTKPIKDEKKYLELFKNVKNEKVIGDSSPTYLWDPKSAEMIYKKIPNAKIIIILRNPIERAFSHYLMLFGRGMTKLSFEQVIKESLMVSGDNFEGRVISGGFYFKQIKRYLDTFPKNQNKIIIFEEFANNTKKSVQDVLNFLEIDDSPHESVNTIYNQYTEPRGGISSSIMRSNKIKKFGKKILPSSLGQSMMNDVLGKKVEKPKLSEKLRTILEDIYREEIIEIEKILDIDVQWLKKKA
ncbi:sulfotransferase [Nitrosopumilus sp.]|uniref:sulfotransferase family protein n=1 Tax=Nitrosopumilus sp. TaxID=2024843 RepID=UPI00262DACAC|nr:sulfotransferase [Nitrosopumilus sp.]